MFFVVDVETSGLTPWSGELLTIGIQAVTETGEIVGTPFYRKIKNNALKPRGLRAMGKELTSTQEFWADQPDYVYEAAYGENHYAFSHQQVIKDIADYVAAIEPDKQQRFIAANPVAFDKMWLESMYGTDYDEFWPFHYRCLCLRSMRYGLEPELTFGSRSGSHSSEFPHHAMFDAVSEAHDLVELIQMKAQIFDTNNPLFNA